MDNYNETYYTKDKAETAYEKYGLLRPDMLAAIAFTYGLPFFGEEEQLPARTTDLIVSIGCGSGQLEKWFEDQGQEVIGVDPAPGAKKLYQGKTLVPKYDDIKDKVTPSSTIIFCESIEHIPQIRLQELWLMFPSGVRVIIVNWLDHHPILPDGTTWNHITPINDTLYSYIGETGKVVLQRGSHFVIDVEDKNHPWRPA